MPVLFWDTSGTIKNYVSEKGSDVVNALFQNSLDFQMPVAILGYAEAFSVLQRKFRDKRIDKNALDTAVSALDADLLYGNRFELLSVDDAAIMGGVRLMSRHTLNSADAAALTLFLDYKRATRPGTVCKLICCDHHMIRAANHEGLLTINPELLSVDGALEMLEECRALET